MEVNDYKSRYQSIEDGAEIQVPKKNESYSECGCSMEKHNTVNYKLEPLPRDVRDYLTM